MKNIYRWRPVFTVIAVFIMLFSPLLAVAAAEVGKTVAVIGSVSVIHQGDDTENTLSVPNPVFLHDTITSTVGSRAKFMLQDESILKLGSMSKIELTKLLVGKESQQTTIKQLSGQLRILLGKKLKPGSHFEIHSPVAVAGVRGTDFELIVRTGGKTAIRCFEGEVAVANVNKDVIGEVRLKPNHYTIVEKDTPPIDPIPIPAGQSLASVLGIKKAKRQKDESSAETDEFQEDEKVEGEHDVIESEADIRTGVNNNRNQEGKLSVGSAGPAPDPLDAAESAFVPLPVFVEGSGSATQVLNQLGINPDGIASAKPTDPGGIESPQTQLAVDDVWNDSIAGTSGVGPDLTISEPVLDTSSVSIQVVFPTP